MENLLDDHNIEAELPSSFLAELKRAGRWLLISAAMAILFGIVAMFAFGLMLLYGTFSSPIEYFMFIDAFICGISLLSFAYYQFRYLRAVQWVEVDSRVYTFDDIARWGHKMWRSLAVLLFAVGTMIISINFMAFSKEDMAEPMIEPVSIEPVRAEPAVVDTIETLEPIN